MNHALPIGWTEAAVAAIADDIAYGYTAKATELRVGPKMLRITDIQNGRVDWKTVPHCRIEPKSIDRYRLENGDILFARTGATTGKSFLVGSCPEAVFASYLIRVRPSASVSPRYLARFFESLSYWHQIADNMSGSAQPNCNASKLAEITVPLAPIREQHRIVAKLDAILANVQACQNRLEHVPAILKRFRQSVLADACNGRLTEAWRRGHLDIEPASVWFRKFAVEHAPPIEDDLIPETWLACPVRALFSVQTGATPLRRDPRYYRGGTIPWIKTAEVQNCEITEAAECITKLAVKETNAKVFPKGTILIAMYGEGKTRGQVGRLQIEAATNQACAALINPRVPPSTNDYAFLFCQSQYQRLREESFGGNQPNLSLGVIKDWKMALPPVAEQEEIVRSVQKLFTLADQIEARYAKAKAQVDALTHATLTRAFRGQLVPTEAELAEAEGRTFESAEELLARIQNQKNRRLEKRRAARRA